MCASGILCLLCLDSWPDSCISCHTYHHSPARRSLWKVAARVPWPALLACCLYLPGIVLWAVYSLHCKANTFLFLTTVAPVAQETVDAVTNTVNTTLFTLAAGGTFIFALLLVLAIARSIQRAGVAPNNCCPCGMYACRRSSGPAVG